MKSVAEMLKPRESVFSDSTREDGKHKRACRIIQTNPEMELAKQ